MFLFSKKRPVESRQRERKKEGEKEGEKEEERKMK
jgi:hypothetical protein